MELLNWIDGGDKKSRVSSYQFEEALKAELEARERETATA